MTENMRSESTNLDILRSMAVLFVVISHLPNIPLLTLHNYYLPALGLLGVAIFFVHTCLVLMFSLERQTAIDGEHNRAISFLVRRILRIYPLSIVTVVMVSGIEYYLSGHWNIRTLFSNILLIQNITGDPSNPGALWSLPYEVQMYLLLPILYVIVSSNNERAATIRIGAIWLAAVSFVLVLWKFGLNYHLVKYLPCFIPGVLAFSLRKSERNFKSWWLFLYVLVIAALYPTAVAMGAKENILVWPVCLILGLLIPKCAEINQVWIGKIGKLVAKYSFGIYLVHGPLIRFSFVYFENTSVMVQCLIFFGSTACLSYIAFHLIESPGIYFGRQMTHRFSNSRHI